MSVHPLRAFREKQDISQAQLAQTLGVSRQMVGLIEASKRLVSPAKAIAWERSTGIPREAMRPDIFGQPSAVRLELPRERAA